MAKKLLQRLKVVTLFGFKLLQHIQIVTTFKRCNIIRTQIVTTFLKLLQHLNVVTIIVVTKLLQRYNQIVTTFRPFPLYKALL